MMTFEQFFKNVTAPEARTGDCPHTWQAELARCAGMHQSATSVRTGMGKTLGVLSVGTYLRVQRRNINWPMRLVWCVKSGARHEFAQWGRRFATTEKGYEPERKLQAAVCLQWKQESMLHTAA